MRPSSAVAIAVLVPLLASGPLQAEPAREPLRVVPKIAPGQLVSAPNARQIAPMVGPSQASVATSVSDKAQKAMRHAGAYLNGIARAVTQAVALQAASPTREAPTPAIATHSAPAAPVEIAAAPEAPQLVRGVQPAVRPAAPSQPVLVSAPIEITRIARKPSATKIAVYTCRLGEDYSLALKTCVPGAKPSASATTVAAAASGVTAVRTIARAVKSGSGSKTVLAGRIDGPGSGRMALGAKGKQR